MNINIPAESIITTEFEAALQQAVEKSLAAAVEKLVEAKQEKLAVTADEGAAMYSMSRRAFDALDIPRIYLNSRPLFRLETLREYLTEKEGRGDA